MRNILVLIILFFITLLADEGQYPLSQIDKLDLTAKGLEMDPADIFNPDKISLSDAIVNIGGCTGSFISPEGLMLTNHHCAFRAVQSASSAEHDYLTKGFSAADRSGEIPARGYTVRITQSFKDVSAEILSSISEKMSGAERAEAVEQKRKKLVKEAEEANPGMRAEVAEMFTGKSYVLFLYTYIKDVRLVFVPPRAVGEFGGEEDNWMWPRHNADFAILRAYVGPDGKPADYSRDNVPYRPKRFLQINGNGVKENDFVMILGYPGKTYRHRTASYLNFEEKIRMPFVADWYSWQIRQMEERGSGNPELAIRLAGRIKGLANTMKNYYGKLRGLARIGLLEQWRERDRELQRYIDADSARKAEYGEILSQIDHFYRDYAKIYCRNAVLGYLKRSPYLISFAYQILKSAEERRKPDLERDSWYMERNFDRFKRYIRIQAENFDAVTDKIILRELLKKAYALPEDLQIKEIKNYFGDSWEEDKINEKIAELYGELGFIKPEKLEKLLELGSSGVEELEEPAIEFVRTLMPLYGKLEKESKARRGTMENLSAKLLDIRREFLKGRFIPDANGTFRLTFGRIRGYEPRDAVCMKPFTTVRGLLEKETGKEPFIVPDKLRALIVNKDFGRFVNPAFSQVTACMLYDLDTTGGNSGSPVLNAKGELVGLNFDRTIEATINDFAWNESYSRSIGVDIRYILWLLDKYADQQKLLKEIGAF
jgi:hypothetical protein